MTEHDRIFHTGMFAGKYRQIGMADRGGRYAHDRLARCGDRGGAVNQIKMPGGCKHCGACGLLHALPLETPALV